jgi:hypothetical protein
VRENLSDLKLAVEGTIVMSEHLRSLLDAMYDARVPESWEKMSWQSTTLGFWYTELLERDSQFRRWCFMGRPKVQIILNTSSHHLKCFKKRHKFLIHTKVLKVMNNFKVLIADKFC